MYARMIEPVFILHKDIKGLISSKFQPIKICRAIHDVIADDLHGAQQYFGVWKIYIKSLKARETLLNAGFTIRDTCITVHDKNPFDDKFLHSEKITILDLPLSFSDDNILNFLKQHGHIKLQTNVLYGKVMSESNSKTAFENGDRFLYANAGIIPALPERVTIDGHRCRIYHKNQQYKCHRCRKSDHKVEDTERCPAHLENPNVIPFRDDSHVLSNYHLCEINYDNKVFASVEHAYQYAKCRTLIKDVAADDILKSPTGKSAKLTANRVIKDVADLHVWRMCREDVMYKILEQKARCYQPFREFLLNSGSKILVEATQDDFWGACLTPSEVKVTHPDFLNVKGNNILGEQLMYLRKELNKEASEKLNKSVNKVSTEVISDLTSNTTSYITANNAITSTATISSTISPPSLSTLASSVLHSASTISSFPSCNSDPLPSLRPTLSTPSSSKSTPTLSKRCTIKKDRNNKHKNKISDYYTPERESSTPVKRKTESPQENGPIPPGILGSSSNKVICCEDYLDNTTVLS